MSNNETPMARTLDQLLQDNYRTEKVVDLLFERFGHGQSHLPLRIVNSNVASDADIEPAKSDVSQPDMLKLLSSLGYGRQKRPSK